MRTTQYIIANLIALILGSFATGCSTGTVGARAFTSDSRYLVWEDFRYCIAPPLFASFCTKRTDCESGRTIVLGSGDFVPDLTGEHALLFPSYVGEKKWELIQIEDAKRVRVPTPPGDDLPPETNIINLTVATFDPPDLTFTIVNDVRKRARVYEFREAAWHMLSDNDASDVQLSTVCSQVSQSAFIGEQVRTRMKETKSPNEQVTLVEFTTRGLCRAELRCNGGKSKSLLTIQTDQPWEGLRLFSEFLVYGGKK